MRRSLAWLVVFVAIAPLLVQCQPSPAPTPTVPVPTPTFTLAAPPPSPTPQPPVILVVGRTAEAAGLDPHSVPAHSSWRVFELIYNTVVTLDEDLAVVPELAESWEIKDGGKQYVFHLRPGIRFHNGDELTAQDVKFTFERILDPDTGAIARSLFVGITSIDTPDDYTVIFTLDGVNAAFLSNLTNANASIVSKKVMEGAKVVTLENSIGTGPFKLVEWIPDNYMLLQRHTNFFIKGKPLLDGIKLVVIPSEEALLAALRTKEVDLAIIEDPKTALAARGEEDLQVLSTPSIRYNLLFINGSREPFDDARVRQAISCAIDRQAIIDAAAFGEGVITGPFPPSLKLYALPVTEFPCYERDLEKAKELLQEAGYPEGFAFTMMTQVVEPASAPAIAEAVQRQLKEIGIDMDIELQEWGVWVERWKVPDFDMCPGLNSGSPDPDYYYYRYMHTGEGLNFVTSYSSPVVDELLEEGRATTDLAKRQEIYGQLQRELVKDSPFIWLYVGYEYRVLQPYVKGYTAMANASIQYLRDTWLEK